MLCPIPFHAHSRNTPFMRITHTLFRMLGCAVCQCGIFDQIDLYVFSRTLSSKGRNCVGNFRHTKLLCSNLAEIAKTLSSTKQYAVTASQCSSKNSTSISCLASRRFRNGVDATSPFNCPLVPKKINIKQLPTHYQYVEIGEFDATRPVDCLVVEDKIPLQDLTGMPVWEVGIVFCFVFVLLLLFFFPLGNRATSCVRVRKRRTRVRTRTLFLHALSNSTTRIKIDHNAGTCTLLRARTWSGCAQSHTSIMLHMNDCAFAFA